MKLMIYFENSQDRIPIGYNLKMLIRRSLIAALMCEKVGGKCEISVTFTDNDGIQKINKEFRNIDAPTDVLSFPQIDFENPVFFGSHGGSKFFRGEQFIAMPLTVIKTHGVTFESRIQCGSKTSGGIQSAA